MEITFALPGALQPFAGGAPEVTLDAGGATVADALAALAGRHGGVVDRVLTERGEVRQHVNVFVDGDNIRFLAGLETPVARGSTITIVPAVSGG
jgi:molybdopterin converting factor small subunit